MATGEAILQHSSQFDTAVKLVTNLPKSG